MKNLLICLPMNQNLKKTGILHIMYKEQVERHDVKFATKKTPSSSNNILHDLGAVESLLVMKTKILPEHVHTAMENQSKMNVAQHQHDVLMIRWKSWTL